MGANERFAEYATSGAFALTLTRAQVSQLAIMADGGDVYAPHALLRKGLADELPRPDLGEDRSEVRATRAGLLAAELCAEAGLTNRNSGGAEHNEIERLHALVTRLRH